MKSVLCSVFFILLLAASCKKDDNCDEDSSLETVIVGEWEVKTFGIVAGEVEFLADGTLIDMNDIIIGGEVGGVMLNEKSYVVIGDTIIEVRAENAGQFLEYDVNVTSYSCDEVRTTIVGFDVILDRK